MGKGSIPGEGGQPFTIITATEYQGAFKLVEDASCPAEIN